jgi:hypothetical protein
MKKLLFIGLLVFTMALSAQYGVYVRFFDSVAGVDFTPIDNIAFEVELEPGSGDIQTGPSAGCFVNYVDVGAGFPNAFVQFDLANFANPYTPASNVKVTIWDGANVLGAGTATYNVGTDMDPAGGFMGWEEFFAVGGFPIMVEPDGPVVPEVIIDDLGNVSGGDVTGSGQGGTEAWHNDIPYNGSVGVWFELLLDDADFPLTYRVTMDQSGMLASEIPGQLGWRILPAGAWTFIPAVAPFQLAWNDMGTANAYYDIIITGGKAGRAPVSVGVALSDAWDEPLPVTLTSFLVNQAQNYGQYATIAWTVQSESNMLHYNLYRSESDLASAIKIATVGAENSSELHTYSHVDNYEIAYETTYYYWLEGVEANGVSETMANGEVFIEVDPNFVPMSSITKLGSNYPNPFNPLTTIKYYVKQGQTASLQIYNAKGQLVQTATLSETPETGADYKFEGSKYGSGIYFYRLKTDNYSEVKKMMMLK